MMKKTKEEKLRPKDKIGIFGCFCQDVKVNKNPKWLPLPHLSKKNPYWFFRVSVSVRWFTGKNLTNNKFKIASEIT